MSADDVRDPFRGLVGSRRREAVERARLRRTQARVGAIIRDFTKVIEAGRRGLAS